MRRIFDRFAARLSLFWRYFILLSAVMVLFLTAFSVSTRLFTQSLQDSYLTQAQESFNQNCQSFSRALFLSHTLPSALENSNEYSTITSADHPLENQLIPSLLALRESFTIQCTMLDLPAECFLLFGRSQACLTRSSIYTTGEDCFSSYLVYEDGGAALRAALEQPRGHNSLSLLPAQNVSVAGAAPAPYLTLLSSSTYGTDTYGFLYSDSAVSEHFQLSSLPADTYLQLVRSNGTVLFSHGQASEDGFIRLTCAIPSLSCDAVIGIPRAFFLQTTQSARTIPLLVFLLCMILGIAMCFAFSHISVRPFRRLIEAHAMDENAPAPENELATIDSFLRTTQQRTAALHGMLTSSLLVRSFSGQPIRQDEYQSLSAAFPQFQQPQCAAIIRDRSSDSSLHHSESMFNLLRDTLPEQFLCEYISLQEVLVLLPAEPADLDLLQTALTDLSIDGSLPRFFCGVSAPFVGLSELPNAIRQAQFCISADSRRPIIRFSEETVGANLSSSGTAFDLKRFQQALSTWNQHELLALLDQACTSPDPHPEELFYSILFLLRDAAVSGNMKFPERENCTYLPTGTPAANLQRLKDLVNDLFRQKSALQLSDKQQLCEDMVDYIRQNFSDPTLCLFSLSQQFGVSERYTHNAIQSSTGMNFSNFLLRCRMQEAARLLQQADTPINQVAEQCGYPAISTFYRNFKKYYQMTPADYKDSVH
ncbi:MAG: helix-turn-helix transcriptional regulator [Oscillospiraceae bacterium]|nr:helix-turn-helix transcriptional regulator [Oscillospiraceae bacterium]